MRHKTLLHFQSAGPAVTSVPTPSGLIRYPLTAALLAYWETESTNCYQRVLRLDIGRRAARIPSYKE